MRPKNRSIFKPSGTLGGQENATKQKLRRLRLLNLRRGGRATPGPAKTLAMRQHRQQQQRHDVGDLDHRVHRRARRILVRVANSIASDSGLMGF